MAAALGLGLVFGPAPVPADTAPARPFGDWLLVGTPPACQLTTQVISQAAGQRVLEFILIPPPDGRAGARAGVRVPTGASLRDGIAFRHPDGPPTPLEWQSCDAEMCLAATELDEQGLRRLLRGNRVVVGFRPLPGARLVNIEVSLRGTTAGWAALQGC